MREWICKLLFRAVGVAALACILLTEFTPISNQIARNFEYRHPLRPADLIVVLGGGVEKDGRLSDGALQRIIHGIKVYHQHLAPRILFSGSQFEGTAEASVAGQLAETFGIPSTQILRETNSNTTREEAVHIAPRLRAEGVKVIILITSSPHSRRAAQLFEKSDFRVISSPADNATDNAISPGARLLLMRDVLKEAFGIAYYHVVGYL